MTAHSSTRIRGVPDLDLEAGEYAITPSERSRNWDEQLADALTGDADLGLPPLFDVVKDTGCCLLEVVEHGESNVVNSFGVGDGAFTGLTYRHFVFRTPDGEARLVMHRGGIATTYTLRATATGDVLATWSKSLGILGKWQLAAPDGNTRATMTRERSAGTLLSFSHRGSYAVRSPDDTDLARFERTRQEGRLTGMVFPELEVLIEGETIPPEICLGLGVAVLLEARVSGSGHHSGGGE